MEKVIWVRRPKYNVANLYCSGGTIYSKKKYEWEFEQGMLTFEISIPTLSDM